MESSHVIIPSEGPKLYRGSNAQDDAQKMIEDGYILLGYSSFNAGGIGEKQAIAHGQKIHASVILVYSEYTNTVSGSIPLTLPDTKTATTYNSGSTYGSGNIYGYGGSTIYSGSGSYSGSSTTTISGTKTTYIPYSVNRYNYLATYWIKGKPLVLGVHCGDLTPEIRKEISSNKGVMITAVVKGSPAFLSDLLVGDIIKKIDDTEIIDTNNLLDFLESHAGKRVAFHLIRDGETINKTIQLNTKEY